MKDSHYRISLDIHSTQSQVSLPVKQGDTSRKVFISLCEGGKPYQIEEDCIAVFSATKPGGEIIENHCDIADNVIEYDITRNTSASSGIVDCEIRLYGGDGRLITSPSFTVVVYSRAARADKIESTDEYTALDNLYLTTIDAISNANGKADYAQEQGDYAQSQGDYAKEKGDDAATATTNTKMATTKATAATTKANDAATLATEQANAAATAASDATEQADKARIAADLANAAADNANETASGIRNSVSNALKGTASGNPIRLEDVSPLVHEMRVRLSDPSATLTRCGKNLLPYPYYYKTSTVTGSGLTFTDHGDGTVTVNGTSTARVIYYLQYYDGKFILKKGENYILSGCPSGGSSSTYIIQGTDGTTYHTDFGNGKSFTADGNGYYFYIVVYEGVTLNNVTFKPQLALGTVATPHEPYKGETYTPTADGTVDVTSLYPTTTLLCDTEGVTIDVEYNRDANKVIDELIDMIGSGGSGGASAFVTDVTILANKWVGTSSPYSQVVTVKGATNRSQVDLTPSAEQLAIFHNKDLAFVTENNNGVITVYAIGQKPMNDYTIQATVTEVKA